MKACEEIRENLRPILEKLEKPSWEKLISEAHNAKVKLSASYTYEILIILCSLVGNVCKYPTVLSISLITLTFLNRPTAKDELKGYDVWVT